MSAMSLYPPPETLTAEVWTAMPAAFRRTGARPDWARANRPGLETDGFLEGPCLDAQGHLWVTDIPFGRIFRISPAGDWSLVAEYDGWPNGMKLVPGGAWIADYRHGLMRLDAGTGTVAPVLTHRYSERFRGCNDLCLDRAGRIWFTDQGQSGMHRADGRVYRYDPATDRLELLLDTGPSPNGLVLDPAESALMVGMTRGNCVWRVPLMADGGISKAGVFIQLSGGFGGPDGLALDRQGGLWVAHVGNGCVWGFSALGHPRWRVLSPSGLATTNIVLGGAEGRTLYVTQSDTGEILRAEIPERPAA